MATPAQIRQAVDDRLTALWNAIQNKQDNYAANHGGKYWQGLRTHSIDPADGTAVLPSIGTACPTDQPGQPWPNAILTTPIEMSLQIDCYDGPQGKGYQATVTVTISGNTWIRTAQVGPETYRAHGWRQL